MSILQSEFCETGYFLCLIQRILLRASFALSVKNEFVSSGTLLGFAHPNPARFDFISQFCRKICKGFLQNDYGTDENSAPSFLFFQLASVKNS